MRGFGFRFWARLPRVPSISSASAVGQLTRQSIDATHDFFSLLIPFCPFERNADYAFLCRRFTSSSGIIGLSLRRAMIVRSCKSSSSDSYSARNGEPRRGDLKPAQRGGGGDQWRSAGGREGNALGTAPFNDTLSRFPRHRYSRTSARIDPPAIPSGSQYSS